MKPKVSVLMITYKHEKFINQAINSVLEQITNFNFELIIADDNSPDETYKVVSSIKKNHPKGNLIKYFKNDINLGPNKNYIKAYNYGSGKYIAVCEGDDYWGDKFKLQKQVDFLDENSEYVLTYHDSLKIYESRIIPNKSLNDRMLPIEFSNEELLKGKQPLFLTTCYRRLPIDFPLEMADIINGDTYLISILGNYGRGRWLNIKPAFYRQHDGGIWSLKRKEYKFKAKIQVFRKLKKLYKSKDLYELESYYKKQEFKYSKILVLFYFKKFKWLSGIRLIINLIRSKIKIYFILLT